MAGTPGAPNRLFTPASERVEQVNSDRAPSRRGFRVVKAVQVPRKMMPVNNPGAASQRSGFVKPPKPWSRMDQAIKAVDLLLQGGGFGAIVLDLGSIEPRFARRIPLATWFRWRAAAERTRTSLVVLSQMCCTGSSAELVVRVEAELPEQQTVLTGISYRLEVVRRRFAASEPSQDQGDACPQATAISRRMAYAHARSGLMSLNVLFGCFVVPQFSAQAMLRLRPQLGQVPAVVF